MPTSETTCRDCSRPFPFDTDADRCPDCRRADLAAALRGSSFADVLDDAVLGCLLDSTVLDVLDGHGLPDDADTRRWLGREIDAAIREGN